LKIGGGTMGIGIDTPLPKLKIKTEKKWGGFLDRTDKWWDSLTDEEKVDVYNEFFNYS
jgi:predicted acetyltransferase